MRCRNSQVTPYLTGKGERKGKGFPTQTMKAYRGSTGIAPLILTSTLYKGQRLASRPGRHNPVKEPLNRMLVWTLWKIEKKSLTPYWDSNPRPFNT
jgi:hypothetical protein